MDISIFSTLGKLFDNATKAFVTSNATSIMAEIKPVAIIGITLYIVIFSYSVLGGYVQEPIKNLIYKCGKIVLISFFAFNIAFYLDNVVGTINGLQDGLASTLGHKNSNGIYGQLDTTLGKGFDLMSYALKKAANCTWYELGSIILWYIVAGLVAISSIAIVLTGGMMIITASLLLKILFSIGPLFIMCSMFPMTTRFFESWFGQVINYVLTIVFVAVVMAFAIEIYTRIIGAVDFDSQDGNTVVMAIELVLVGYVLYRSVLKTGEIASGLAGGVSLAAMSLGQIAAATLAPLAVAGRVASKARNFIDPMTTRRDMQSGMMVTARRNNHLLAGNTALNPAYRQHVMQNMFRNWGRKKGGDINP